MKEQYIKIINILSPNRPTTSNKLAYHINVSVRTVKTRIKEINEIHENLILSTNKGYLLNQAIFKKLNLDKYNQEIKNYDREFELLKTLINVNAPINIYDLAENMFISDSTLKSDINKAKIIANNYDVEIINKDENISLVGCEENMRKLQSFIIYNYSNIDFLSDEYIQNSFPNINISLIRYIIEIALSNNKFMINDFAMNNLILHLAIIIKRYKFGETIIDISDYYIDDNLIYNLSKEIMEKIEYYFEISVNKNEVKNFAIILMSRVNKLEYINMAKNNLDKIISPKNLDIIQYVVNSIKDIYNLNLYDDKYYVRFCLHINNVLIRGYTGHTIRNPMTETIKSSAPLVYEISVTIAALIKDKVFYNIGEDEIAYISFHIGGTIEEIYYDHSKISTLVYAPNYFDLNQNIGKLIKKHFNDDLYIVDYTNNADFSRYENLDLILSTLPAANIYKQMFVTISPINNNENYYKIRDAVEYIKNENFKKKFGNNLRKIFNKDLFVRTSKYSSFNGVIDFMVSKLMNKGYVSDNYKKRIIDREKLSSTAIGYFALPHPINFNASRTTFSVLISDKDIDWNGKNVRLIIMMSFNKDERTIFNEIYEPLTKILLDNDHYSKIIKSKNYEDFINNLVNSVKYRL